MERDVLIGVDLGTSAVKVLACTPDAKIVAEASAAYALATPHSEWVEQDADEVYRATMKTLRGVLGEVRLRGNEVAAIGLSCAMHGVLAVDAAGEPDGPLITWMDRRSAEISERWRSDGTASELYPLTGAPMHPMLPSCKLRWLAENDRARFARAARFVSLKELLVFRWTGEWQIDWGMASGTGLFDFRAHAWSARALQIAGVDAAKLSTPAPPSTQRRLRPTVASALGITPRSVVVLASSDGALANLGVGAVGAGELALTLGTSGAIRVVSEQPELDERGRTFCYCFDDTRYVIGGPTSSAGAVLAKLHELFLSDIAAHDRFDHAAELAQSAPPGANGLTILPFLSGERAPYWMAHLRGAIFGLDLSHTRSDICLAAFESVVLALATVFDILREHTPKPARIRLSGGLTHAAIVRQLVADIFACEAVLSDHDEASAFGAAMLAGIAIGAVPQAERVGELLKPVYVHAPDPTRTERYQEIGARYRACAEANLHVLAHKTEAPLAAS